MALHFGKRDPEPTPIPQQPVNAPRYGASGGGTPPGAPASSAEHRSAAPAAYGTPVPEGGSKLTVGPNIKLKGVEITDCDTLFVEGLVEATMDSRVIQIAQQGAFKGTAEIDIAEIHGVFDGHLTVRQKLVIYATGKVTGKIRYGKVVIEEGGQLSGDIECTVAVRPGASVGGGAASGAPRAEAALPGKPSMALAA